MSETTDISRWDAQYVIVGYLSFGCYKYRFSCTAVLLAHRYVVLKGRLYLTVDLKQIKIFLSSLHYFNKVIFFFLPRRMVPM